MTRCRCAAGLRGAVVGVVYSSLAFQSETDVVVVVFVVVVVVVVVVCPQNNTTTNYCY